MADRYYVPGGTNTWSNTANWSASSTLTPTGASVPTNTDNVFFTSATSYTVNITSASQCLNFTASAGSPTITMTGSLSVAGNFDLTGSTTTWSASTSGLFFQNGGGGSATPRTVNSAGVTIDCPITVSDNVASTVRLIANLTMGSTRLFTFSAGVAGDTFDLNGFTLTCGTFNSANAITRTLAFGSGKIVVQGTGSNWDTSTITGLTITGTPTIDFTYSGATAMTVRTGALTEAAAPSLNFINGSYALSFATSSVKNISFTFTTCSVNFSGVTCYGNMTLSSTMTVPAAGVGIIFAATSGVKIITSNNVSFGNNITFSGVGGSWQLFDNLSAGSAQTVTLTNGTLDLNGKILSTGLFASNNSNVRTIAFGSGNITCTSNGTVWDTATVTNLTVTGTPVVNVTYASSLAITVNSGILTEAQAISFNFTAGTYSLTFLGTVSYSAKNVNFTGFAGTWAARTVASTIYGSLTLSTGMTFASSTGSITFGATSGTQNITFNGKSFNAPFIVNAPGATVRFVDTSAFGSTQTLNNGTFDANGQVLVGAFTIATGSVILKGVTQTTNTINFTQSSGTVTLGSDCNTNVGTYTLTAGTLDLAGFQLTTGSFASSNSNVRTIAFGSGNITCVTNGTVWTTATATNLTITGTPTVNISYNGALATTVASGATTEATVLSFNITAGTYTLTFPTYFKSVNFTGFSGTWTPAAQALQIFGDVTLSSTMTFGGGAGGSSFVATSGTQTITSNGKSWATPITQSNAGATLKLADALTQTTYQYLHNSGTLDLNGQTLTTGTNYTTGVGTKNITFNAGILRCSNGFNNAQPTGFTTTAGTGTGKIAMARTTTQTFTGGGSTYNCTISNDAAGALTLSGNNTITTLTTASGAISITGSNTITTISNSVQPVTFTLTSGTTQTITNWNLGGVSGSLVTINSSVAGTAATISKASGTVNAYFVSLQDNAATGGASWYVPYSYGSVNVSGNSGWVFGVAKYWVGGTGNWSTAARWATSSGGAGGAGISSIDGAVLDSLSGGGTSTVDSNVSIQSLIMTGYTGTIAFGTNAISVAGVGTAFTGDTTYSVTGTPVINVTSTGSTAIAVNPGIVTEANSISFNFTGGTYTCSFLTTVNHKARSVNFTGFAGTWGSISAGTIFGDLTLSAGMTLTATTSSLTFAATSGTKIITSNGKTMDFLVTFNGIGGTWQLADALTLGAARTLTLTNGTLNINNQTVTTGLFASSSANIRTIAFGTGNISCIGASGTLWTTATVTNLTVTGTPSIYISSTGSTTATVSPGSLSEASSMSFNITSGTYTLTITGGSIKNLNFTGFNGTWGSIVSGTLFVYGDLTLSSSAGFVGTAGGTLTFASTSATVRNIVSNGKSINSAGAVIFNGIGGSWKFIDAISLGSTQFVAGTIDGNSVSFSSGGINYYQGSGNLFIKSLLTGLSWVRGDVTLIGDTTMGSMSFQSGNINLSGYSLNIFNTLSEISTGTKVITFNGGTINIGASFSVSATFSTVAGSAPGYIVMTSASANGFDGGGFTYACTLVNAGAGTLTITGANTFTGISNTVQPTSFVFPSSTTTTVTNWNVSGTAGNLVTITSSTAGTPATLSKASGTVSSNYLSLKDSAATGGATWYAGANSTNVSGNTGWIFSTAPSTASGNFFTMF